MPGKRATSRVERAIILLTALKPDRMGAERARLLNNEQRRPFVVTQIRDQSDFLRITPPIKRQNSFALSARVPSFERDRQSGHVLRIILLNGRNPSRYLRRSRSLKGTALRAGPRWLHPS